MSINAKAQKIDKLIIQDHRYLDRDDECFFFAEYFNKDGVIINQGYGAGDNLISNLKIKKSETKRLKYGHKAKAIKQCADLIVKCFTVDKLKECLFIPIPPSKTKDDPEYDDRINQILISIQEEAKLINSDIKFIDLLSTKLSREQTSSHSGKNLTPKEHIDNWVISPLNEDLNKYEVIIIFDDVITTGSQFKAAKNIVQSLNTSAKIIGLFVARRVLIHKKNQG
ncbi:phosphoribosyltransferase [Fluviispira sanaruensis]|uniref:phosphoribosyltransferase n=1 Tax=Fluviispira sanaruensis TaxID=2493639 RepID=UPI00102E8BC6|nr:hypothetical protein [Fluviispira sanaruensis]